MKAINFEIRHFPATVYTLAAGMAPPRRSVPSPTFQPSIHRSADRKLYRYQRSSSLGRRTGSVARRRPARRLYGEALRVPTYIHTYIHHFRVLAQEGKEKEEKKQALKHIPWRSGAERRR